MTPTRVALRARLALARAWLGRLRATLLSTLLHPRRALPAAALALALSGSPLHAAPNGTITVTATSAVGFANDGLCSLAEAIVNANNDMATHPNCAAGNGADTIVLPTNATFSYTTPLGPSGTLGDAALPLILSPITIQGNGSTLRRDPTTTPLFRLITATSARADLTLNGITCREGKVSGSTSGGCLLLDDGAVGTVNQSLITLNSAPNSGGGAIFASRAVLTVNDSQILRNSANTGAGIGVSQQTSSATINGSTILSNTATVGGGIFATRYAILIINDSDISSNQAPIGGGGLKLFDHVSASINNSTIASNTVAVASGGGLTADESTGLILQNSTVSHNFAAQDVGGVVASGNVTLTNVTISHNTTNGRAGGVFAGLNVILQNCTITGNSAAQKGGGLFLGTTGSTLVLSNSIISGNQAGNGPEIYTQDVFLGGGNIVGYSGSTRSLGFVPAPSDITPAGPLASILDTTLADNGGPTMTHNLVMGSPAMDALTSGPATDQRGIARPIDGDGDGTAKYDVGAVEYNLIHRSFLPLTMR